jgi:hypothetical protein
MTRSIRNRHVGTFVALALIAAGLTGTIVDNDGKVGLALFVTAAAGVVFLAGRWLATSPGPRVATVKVRRPQMSRGGQAQRIVSGRSVAVAVVAMGVMLSATNVFKADDDGLGRALNYGAWYGFLLLAVSLVAVSVVTARRWLASKPGSAVGR